MWEKRENRSTAMEMGPGRVGILREVIKEGEGGDIAEVRADGKATYRYSRSG